MSSSISSSFIAMSSTIRLAKAAAAATLLLLNAPSSSLLSCSSFRFPSSSDAGRAASSSSRRRDTIAIASSSPRTSLMRASSKLFANDDDDDDQNDAETASARQRRVVRPPPHRAPASSGNGDANDGSAATTTTTEEERQLREAMEELRLAQEEATKYENELASLLLLEAEIAAQAALEAANEAEEAAAAATAATVTVTEEVEESTPMTSVASAYKAALDAANDDINILNTRVYALEGELVDTIAEMERTAEDKERIGAEYAYLAKNYGELLKSSGGSNAAKNDEAAAAEEEVDVASLALLNEEIGIHRAHIADLTTELSNVESALLAARAEANNWSFMYNDIVAQMTNDAKIREEEHNVELGAARTRVDDELLVLQRTQRENDIMILSLREALNDARDEMRNEKEKSTVMERQLTITTNDNTAATAKAAAEIEDVRLRMSAEITNLKDNIQNLQVELDMKEQELRYALEGKVETKKLMDEIRVLRLSMDDKDAKSNQGVIEYEERLAMYSDMEKEMKLNLVTKEGTIANLTQAQDINARQIAALLLEVEVLERQVTTTIPALEATNVSLERQLIDVRSDTERRIENANEKISALRDELNAKDATTADDNLVSIAELERVRTEMSNSLLKANDEIDKRDGILAKKEKMLTELQSKYDAVLNDMEIVNNSAKTKIDYQAEQLRTLDMMGKEQQGALETEISELRRELDSVKSNSQETITALTTEIKDLSREIKEAQRLRDEAMQTKSKLEQSLLLAVENAEKAMRTQSVELESMNVQVENAIAAVTNEAEKSKQLQSDVKNMSELLNNADLEIRQRDDELRMKESSLSEMMKKNEQLSSEINIVQTSSQKDVLSKVAEIDTLKGMVSNLTASVDKEISLRQEVLSGKTGIESLLQQKLDDATKAVEIVRAEARKALDSQAVEMRKLQDSAANESIDLTTEINQLKKDMMLLQTNSQKAIDDRTNEIRKLDTVISTLKANIVEEIKLKESSMEEKAKLEKALQMKIDQLTQDISVAQKNAIMVVNEKNMEIDRLDTRIKELTSAVQAETALKLQATTERDSIESQLKTQISQLEKKLVDDQTSAQVALQQRDELVLSMQVEMTSLTKAKEEVENNRRDIENEMSTKIFELRNKVSAIQMNTDQTIQAKSDEVDSLRMQLIGESKVKDALLKNKSDELVVMNKKLHAEYELVAQITKNMNAIHSAAVEATKQKKQALAEKVAIESQMQQLRNNVDTISGDNSEEDMKESVIDIIKRAELERVDNSAKVESQAELTKKVSVNETQWRMDAEELATKELKTRQTNVQESSKAKGFGKSAPKKRTETTTKIDDSKESIVKASRIAAEEEAKFKAAEEEEARWNAKVEENVRRKAEEKRARMKLAEEETNRSEGVKDLRVKQSSDESNGGRRTNTLRQLITPQGRGNEFVKRNTAEGALPRTSKEFRSGMNKSLVDILVEQDRQNQASFPKRNAIPAPSSQTKLPRQGSPSTNNRSVSPPSSQGDTRKHTISSPFPKREASPAPSSQSPIRRQGAPAPPNSPATTILGTTISNSPLTSLLMDASLTTAAFPTRKNASSQAEQLVGKKRQSLSNLIQTQRRIDSTDLTPATKERIESIVATTKKRTSLKDLIPSTGTPIASSRDKKATTKLGGIASPDQTPNPDEIPSIGSFSFSSVASVSKSSVRRSLKDLIRGSTPIDSIGNKKSTTTKLGGIATMKVEKQKKSMKEEVIASATVNLESPPNEAIEPPPSGTYASLSAIINSRNPRQESPLRTKSKERMTTAAGVPTNKGIDTKVNTPVYDPSIIHETASKKIQEAFQRALLSARIANDAHAKVYDSQPRYRNSALSGVVPSQTKPTLSQQKAFANTNRHTSLFPDKLESHLSRLLLKK